MSQNKQQLYLNQDKSSNLKYIILTINVYSKHLNILLKCFTRGIKKTKSLYMKFHLSVIPN